MRGLRVHGLLFILGGCALAVSLLAWGTLTACALGSRPPAPRPNASPAPRLQLTDTIIEAAWLRSHLGDPRLVILDTRDPERYAEGHIPGAVNLPMRALSRSKQQSSMNLPPVSAVQRIFSQAGIDESKTVVVYDDSELFAASRIFWTLEVHGHPRVGVLNGGLAGWQNNGNRLSFTPSMPKEANFIVNLQPDRLATREDVLDVFSTKGTALLDTRSSEFYRGEQALFGRAGHIWSAVNIESGLNLRLESDGIRKLVITPEQASRYRTALGGCKRIIIYDETGIRSAFSYLVLRSLGYAAAIYDGAWEEWSADDSLPVEMQLAG